MDPPWAERGGGKTKRGADRHYRVMGRSRILQAVQASGWWRPAVHAHLYLWVTNNKLPDGLWLMDQLGFRYVSNVCWAKRSYGIGQYFRGCHELLLFGVRGSGMHQSVMRARRDLPSMIVADHVRGYRNRKVHSAKPEVFYELMEARTRGPRIEFFARGAPRKGWRAWGNEVAA